MTPDISVIVPIRNRSGLRLENNLRSLRWQDVPPERVEVIISDFGSEREQAEAVAETAARFDVRVVATRTDAIWNRSRALNIGIKAATAPWVFCTDVDMIFAPNFVRTLLERHRDYAKDLMLHCRCHDLPEGLPSQAWAQEDFQRLLAASEVRPTRGTGACQSARRSFFHRVRGYDEQFRFWGWEDIDMTGRAQLAGLEVEWVSAQTQMLHQWHPKQHKAKTWTRLFNKWRFALTQRRLIKNPGGWGEG